MKQRNGLFVLAIFFTSLNLRPGITSVSPILTRLSDAVGMNGTAASLLTSIPVLCMGIFSPLAVRLGARFGIERVLAGSVTLVGVATFLRIFTHSSFYLLCTAFLIGIGIATAGPLLSGMIKHHFPSKVPAMIGLYSIALSMGAAAGAGLTIPVKGWLGGSLGLALAFWSLLSFASIPVWLLALRHPNVTHKVSAARQHTPLPWRRGRAWIITLFFGLMAFLFYVFTAWLPPIVQSMGWSAAYAGGVLTVFTLVQIPVTFIVPVLTHRFPNRKPWLMLSSLAELTGLIILTFTHISPMVAAIFMGIGAGGLFPLSLLLPIDASATASEASAWSAMSQSFGYIIGAAGPTLVGAIHDAVHSFTLGLDLLIAIVLVMLLMEWTFSANYGR